LRRQAVVASLLGDVFEGRLRAGQHLVTQELATRYGVSHTPVREALIALAGLGVIDLHPNRGAVVRAVSPRDVRELCDVRGLLECEAVRLACGRIDPAELDALADALRRQIAASDDPEAIDLARFLDEARCLDTRLHDRIAASCGNAFLALELTRLKTLFRAFRDVATAQGTARHDVGRLFEESRQHLAIVEALIAGDAEAAVRAMTRHIDASAVVWGKLFGGRPEPEPEPTPGGSTGRPTPNAPPTSVSNGAGTPTHAAPGGNRLRRRPVQRRCVSRHRPPRGVCRGESIR
jgi:DNA-binding GntR family transcriptional regulator